MVGETSSELSLQPEYSAVSLCQVDSLLPDASHNNKRESALKGKRWKWWLSRENAKWSKRADRHERRVESQRPTADSSTGPPAQSSWPLPDNLSPSNILPPFSETILETLGISHESSNVLSLDSWMRQFSETSNESNHSVADRSSSGTKILMHVPTGKLRGLDLCLTLLIFAYNFHFDRRLSSREV